MITRSLQLTFATMLGTCAVIEMAHFRRYQKEKRHRMAFTLTAAIAALYMASEALTGDYPDW